MVNVGASEFVLGVALAVIAGAALVAVLVLLAVTALSSVTVGLTPLMAAMQRKRWREWHPPTSWLPEETEAPRPTCRHRRGFHVTGVVSGQDAGVQARLFTAEAAPEDDDEDGSCARVTMVHAKLEPTTLFEFPAHHRGKVVVCVVAGDGYVGAEKRPVGAGDIAVLDAGAELRVEARSDLLSGPLEVFLLGEAPGHPPVAETPPTDEATKPRHRFAVAVMRGRGWVGRRPPLPQTPRHAARAAARMGLPRQRPGAVGAPRGTASVAQSH